MKTLHYLFGSLLLAGLAARGQDTTETPPTPPPEPPVAVPAPMPPRVASPIPAGKGGDSVGIVDFQGTPLSAVLEYYARLTSRSVIAAPNLAGSIYFRSQTNLTRAEAIQALDSVLALNGVGLVPLGEKFLKVVQIGTAKQEGINVGSAETQPPPAADTLVTRIIALKFADINDVIGALQPYVHAYGQILALSKSNSILVTDTGGNINQMLEIVKYVDQPSPLRMQTKIYTITHAKAADVVARLQAIIAETQAAGGRAAVPSPTPMPVPMPVRPTGPGARSAEETVVEGKVALTADERTNKIFVLSRPGNFTFFDQMIAELDAKVEPDVIVRRFELEYANAEDVAGLINSVLTGNAPATTTRRTTTTGATTPRPPAIAPPSAPATGAGASALEAAGFLQFAEGVRVIPDARTNALLVMATKEDMARLEALIKNVDGAVAQVLIEVVIGEVKLGGELDMGVDIIKRLFTEHDVRMYGGTKTGPSGAPTPVDLTAMATAPLASALTYYATFKEMKLDTVVRLLQTSNKFKVLSTPIIQTLHNQEASIIVGESRPVATSTLSDVVGGSGSNTTTSLRSNIEFKDIAIELKVTPRINPDGMVTVEVDQKVNEAGEEKDVGGVRVPVITKREAKSTVTVKNQNTIVLGGLIKEGKTLSESKVPFLGDIPLIGMAFRDKSVKKERTELIVFIRPTVLRSPAEAQAEAQRRSEMLKGSGELRLHEKFPATPTNDAPTSAVEPPASDRHSAKVRALSESKP